MPFKMFIFLALATILFDGAELLVQTLVEGIIGNTHVKLFNWDTCIKGQIWPPLEQKTESCFSSISSNWFVRRMFEV